MAKRKETEQVMAGHRLTISGAVFHVLPRYAAGHVLNANEAAALEQTRRENIRNNLASKERLTQEQVDEYSRTYEFGVRGEVERDKVGQMALTIARKKVKAPKMTAAEITEAAKALLASEHGEAIRQAAAQLV